MCVCVCMYFYPQKVFEIQNAKVGSVSESSCDQLRNVWGVQICCFWLGGEIITIPS